MKNILLILCFLVSICTSAQVKSSRVYGTGGTTGAVPLSDVYGNLSYSLQSSNRVLASPTSGTGIVSLRLLVAGDIPSLDVSKITTGTLPILRGGTGLTALGTSLQRIRVNSGATALEFFTDVATNSTFATTTDADYTVQSTDRYIVLIHTTALRTLTLPSASANAGRELWIRCTATGSGEWQTGTIGFISCGQIGTPPFTPSANQPFASNTTTHLVSDGVSWYCFQ